MEGRIPTHLPAVWEEVEVHTGFLCPGPRGRMTVTERGPVAASPRRGLRAEVAFGYRRTNPAFNYCLYRPAEWCGLLMDEAIRLIRAARRTMRGQPFLCSELDACTLSLGEKQSKRVRDETNKD